MEGGHGHFNKLKVIEKDEEDEQSHESGRNVSRTSLRGLPEREVSAKMMNVTRVT